MSSFIDHGICAGSDAALGGNGKVREHVRRVLLVLIKRIRQAGAVQDDLDVMMCPEA